MGHESVGEVLAFGPDVSAADKGGLKADDVVLAVDGAQIESMRDLQRIIASTPVGRSVKLYVMRGGKEQELEVVVGPYQTAAPAPRRAGFRWRSPIRASA